MFATLLAILGSFASCSSDDTIEGTTTSNNKGNKTLTIQMSLTPTTRVDYTDDGTNLKAAFAQDKSDFINIFFRKVDGTTITSLGNYLLKCTSVSADGTLATFATSDADISAIPDGTTDVHMILSNGSNTPTFYGTGNFTNDLSTQDGTLATATKHMQWATNHDMTNSANYEVKDGVIKLKNVDFHNTPTICTSILKLNITYPKGTSIVAGETPIKCFSEGAYSKYTCGWGNPNSPTQTNGTTVPFTTTKPAKVTTNSDGTLTATSYICFWPLATSFQVVDFSTIIGDVNYPAEYESTRTSDQGSITGGKMYTVNTTCSTPTKTVTKWYNDDAQTLTITGTKGTTADTWLTMSGSTLSIAANTTGAPRKGAIVVDDNGVSVTYNIVQVAPADFKGTYTFTTKVFAGTGAVVAKADPYTFSTITFGSPRKTEQLTDADGTTKRTNNIGITGLFSTAMTDAFVDINYDAQTIKFGIFLDARDGQGQQVTGNYVAFIPELGTLTDTAWGSPWKFDETELGTPDYTWIWFAVNSVDSGLFNQIIYYNNKATFSTVSQYSSSTMNKIIGFDVVLSTTDAFTASTVSGYAQVYQCNPYKKTGMYFTKTANAAKSYTGSGTITATGYTSK